MKCLVPQSVPFFSGFMVSPTVEAQDLKRAAAGVSRRCRRPWVSLFCLTVLFAGCEGSEPSAPSFPASIAAEPSDVLFSSIGDTVRIAATVLDEDGEPYTAVPTWTSSATDVATVNGGLVTARSNGVARIVATVGQLSAQADVRVEQEADTIIVTPFDVELTSPGDALDLVAVVQDARGNDVTGVPLEWTSSDEDRVRVSASGELTAVSQGDATIQVASGPARGLAQVRVLYANVAITTTSLPSGVRSVAYSYQLEADGGDDTFEWSVQSGSLPPGVTLGAEGLLSGVPTDVGVWSFSVSASSVSDTASAMLSLETSEVPVLRPTDYCSEFPDHAVVRFEDEVLELGVRTLLGLGPRSETPYALTCESARDLEVIDNADLANLGVYGVVSSLWGIQNLVNLRRLQFPNPSALVDLSPLAELTALTTVELPRGNAVEDTGPLRNLPDLRVLDLSNNQIVDLTPLEELTSLESLSLENNQITDIEPLGDLLNLENLRLAENEISDTGSLLGLTAMRRLEINDNALTELTGLAGMTELTTLYVHENQVADISPLSALTKVDTLRLGGPGTSTNLIEDIGPLSGMRNLEFLYLHGNLVSDLEPLRGMEHLTFLNVSANEISDLAPLAEVPALERLDLFSNSIADVTALGTLANLSRLRLGNNGNLEQIGALIDNPGLGAGDEVLLWNTAVSCSDADLLEAKGVEVDIDCP